eukprot:5237934-Pleurochrysis_carterae.AAC.1
MDVHQQLAFPRHWRRVLSEDQLLLCGSDGAHRERARCEAAGPRTSYVCSTGSSQHVMSVRAYGDTM